MKRIATFLCLGFLGVFLSGCLQSFLVISLNADGSGTLELTIIPGEMMLEMMAEFEEESMDTIDDEMMESLATKFGKGVTYVSGEVTDDNALKALFQFEDINTLSVYSDAPSELLASQGVSSSSSGKPLTFKFTPGTPSRLVIHNEPFDDPSQSPETPEQTEENIAAAMEMMKAMMGDMRMSAVIELDGSIKETNAKFHFSSSITLLDFEMGKLLEDEELLRKMAESTGPTPELVNALADTGIQVDEQEEISVTFE